MADNAIKIVVSGSNESLRDAVVANLHAIYKDGGASVDVSNVDVKEPSYKTINDRLGDLAITTIVLESKEEDVDAGETVEAAKSDEDEDKNDGKKKK